METTTLLILIIVAVIVVTAVIVLGAKARRANVASDMPAPRADLAAPPPTPVREPMVEPPVAPSPPPLADEPIVAAAPLEASPASIAADISEPLPEPVAEPLPQPAPVAATPAGTTDLIQLKGLGPKLVATLAELGITRIEQIAALTPDQAEDLDARLGNFRGRLARDRWIDQARLLAAGDRAGYEAEFGKLG